LTKIWLKTANHWSKPLNLGAILYNYLWQFALHQPYGVKCISIPIHIIYHLRGNDMERINEIFNRVDTRITAWMARNGLVFLRISVGIVFLWFGFIKFFPGLSPAQDLATRTIEILSLGLLPARTALLILAAWETIIGVGLLFGLFMRATLLLLFLQMLGTLTPVFLFPNEVFTQIPYAPTLEGQYIIKNMVLISAGLVLGATVRGGRIVLDAGK
jgi:uncharacterized membrane protein YphA (DoxX/SURF4 family)